jgi:hypothetical protein
MAARLEELLYLGGGLVCASGTSFRPPPGTILDADVSAGAGVQYTKLQQLRPAVYSQNGTAASATIPIGVVYGATGTLVSIKAGSIAACAGAATITVDLKKNGSSVLTAVITLDNANTARVMEAGTFSSTSLVTGDFLELVITATAGGGTLGTGLLVQVRWAEDPS